MIKYKAPPRHLHIFCLLFISPLSVAVSVSGILLSEIRPVYCRSVISKLLFNKLDFILMVQSTPN